MMNWRGMSRHASLFFGRNRARSPIATIQTIATIATLICPMSCAAISQHAFVAPANAWHTRSGQLLYRGANITLIGDLLVRYSGEGDFELNFSKAPGITLLALRRDAKFAEIKGPLARMGRPG
jgi:hypothetical protein